LKPDRVNVAKARCIGTANGTSLLVDGGACANARSCQVANADRRNT
jgi:hypothetical protein